MRQCCGGVVQCSAVARRVADVRVDALRLNNTKREARDAAEGAAAAAAAAATTTTAAMHDATTTETGSGYCTYVQSCC